MIRSGRIFVNIVPQKPVPKPFFAPFLTKPVSNESHETGLSIGTGFVKNGPLLTKLWTNKVGEPIKLDPVC